MIAANSIFERIREIVFNKVNDSNIEQQQMFEQKNYSIAKVKVPNCDEGFPNSDSSKASMSFF